MRCVAEGAALAAVIGRAAQAADPRGTVPVLAHLRLTAGTDGRVTVEGSDTSCFYAESFEAVTVEAPGVVLAPVEKLAAFIRNLDEGAQVTLEHDGAAGARLVLDDGSSRARVGVLDPAEFPVWSPAGEPASATLPRAAFLSAMAAVATVCERPAGVRDYLKGVNFTATKGGNVRLVATDGHRMHRAEIAVAAGAAAEVPCIVPRETIARMAKLLDDGDELLVTVAPADNPSEIVCEAGSRRLTSKLIGATFPDTDRLVAADREFTVVTMDAAPVARAVARAAGFEEALEKSGSRILAARLAGGRLYLAGSDAVAGAVVSVPVAMPDGYAREFGINAAYLSDALDYIGGKVALHLAPDALDSINVTGAGEPAGAARLALVMPARRAWPADAEIDA